MLMITLSILRWLFVLASMRTGMGYWQKIFDHANRFKLTPKAAQTSLKELPVPLYIRDGGAKKGLFVKHGNLLVWCGIFLILAILTEVLTITL
jgi:hypothetical protein